MIPHTVPKSPTKGAALAVVPRKGTRASRWVTSVALDVLEASALIGHGALALLLRGGHLGELDVAGPEDVADGAGGERLGGLVDGVEPLRLPEGLEEAHRLVLGAAELEPLPDDDGPGDHRRHDEEEEDAHHHGSAVGDDLEVVELGATRGRLERDAEALGGEVRVDHVSQVSERVGFSSTRRAEGPITQALPETTSAHTGA
jgi:hypothetical protein